MCLIYAAQNLLDEKSIRRFVKALSSDPKTALSTKIAIFDYKYFFKGFFANFSRFDVRYSARKGLDEISRFSRTYQNTMGSTLEHYCDITFDVCN